MDDDYLDLYLDYSEMLQETRGENAKLRELLKYNGEVIEACTSEILEEINVALTELCKTMREKGGRDVR